VIKECLSVRGSGQRDHRGLQVIEGARKLALGNKVFATFYLEGLASTMAAQGQLGWAAQLWGAADRLRQTFGVAVPPVVRLMYEHFVTNLQAQLGEEAFTALWDQGRTMTLDHVLSVGEPAGTFAVGKEESHQFHKHWCHQSVCLDRQGIQNPVDRECRVSV
jgi:hypothetical protein